MKKIIFVLIVLFTCSLSYGQIRVITNGDVGIGTTTPTEQLHVNGRMLIQDGTVQRAGASASLMFERTDLSAFIIGAGGAAGMSWDQDFNFELRSNLRSKITGLRYITNGPLRMKIQGSNGNVGIGLVAPAEKLHVWGNTQTTGVFIESDRRLKSNISDFELGLKEVLKIEPKSYNYKKPELANSRSYGVIAQELQEITPELVSTFVRVTEDEFGKKISEEEFLRINDSSIKWMLVNAIKDQNELIESQKSQIETLDARIERLENLISSNGTTTSTNNVVVELTDVNQGSIKQNRPNPFNSETVIEYTLSKDCLNAHIRVTNMNGQTIKQIQVDCSQKLGSVTLKAGTLSAGTYYYSLFQDGNLVSTKNMVLTK